MSKSANVANLAEARSAKIGTIGIAKNTKKTEDKKAPAEVKAEPKEEKIAEVKKETVKKVARVPAKREVVAPEVKAVVLELTRGKTCKGSVVYANGEGQSIYVKNEYLKDANNPPSTIRLSIEEVK